MRPRATSPRQSRRDRTMRPCRTSPTWHTGVRRGARTGRRGPDTVAALLLVVAAALLWLFVREHGALLGFSGLDARSSLVLAFGLFQLLLLAVTEIASLAHHLTSTSVTVVWSIVVAVGLL